MREATKRFVLHGGIKLRGLVYKRDTCRWVIGYLPDRTIRARRAEVKAGKVRDITMSNTNKRAETELVLFTTIQKLFEKTVRSMLISK